MQPDKVMMIKLSLDKARQALKSAQLNIDNNFLSDAHNRLYYAIFYSVLALGYLEDFKTGNHSELLGWFNKNFIYDKQVFEKHIAIIYKNAYKNRMLYDYTVYEEPDRSLIDEDFKSVTLFIETIEEFIINKL